MSIQKHILNKEIKHPKCIWSSDEDRFLGQLVTAESNVTWEALAHRLYKYTGLRKTGKQCRERYKNYLDPNLNEEQWSERERILLALMQRTYPSKWAEMRVAFRNRSDIKIKNFFYKLMRKTLQFLRTERFMPSHLSKPATIFIFVIFMKILREQYLSSSSHGESSSLPKEKIFVKLIKKYKVTATSVAEQERKLLQAFREFHMNKVLPLQVPFDLSELNLTTEMIEALKTASQESELTSIVNLVWHKAQTEVSIEEKKNAVRLPLPIPIPQFTQAPREFLPGFFSYPTIRMIPPWVGNPHNGFFPTFFSKPI